MHKALKTVLPIAKAIERLLHPYAEVIVHNIKQGQIVAIFNAYSKRKVGDASLFTQEEKLTTLKNFMGPYEKINWDGRKLKSVSSAIRDEKNEVVGMLCINLDISKLKNLHDVLNLFISNEKFSQQPVFLFQDDWQEKINNYVHNYLNEKHLTLETINRKEKKLLIEHLYKIGAFTAKNAAFYIANVLGVSRATIYNYLSKHDMIGE